MTSDQSLRQTDQRLVLVFVATVAVAVVVVVMAVILIPTTFSTRSTSSEVARGNEITGCRALYESEVDLVKIEALVASADLELLTNEALHAIHSADSERLTQLLAEAPVLRAQVHEAVAHAREAWAEFEAAVALSREDPDAFLASCKEAP